MHLQLRTYHDNRTGGEVHTFTQQVLTETSLFTLQTVAQRFQRTVSLTLDGGCLAAVVEQAVHSLLQHTFLVAQNYVRRFDLDESAQTVVTDDHTTVEVVEVRGSETSTIQRNERTEFRRGYRDNFQYHPFGVVTSLRCAECLNDLQALQSFLLALVRTVGVSTVTELVSQCVEVDLGEQVVDSLCTHLGDELLRISIFQVAVAFRQTAHDGCQLVLIKQYLIFDNIMITVELLAVHSTGLYNDVLLVVDD